MDGGIVFLQTAMPLLAVRLGASAIMLGTIGWVAQAVRLPVCLASGHLSERVGRATIIVLAACGCALGCGLMAFARSPWQVMPLYVLALASIGAFFAPLQAMIGDMSERGQLRRNLGSYNIGWCVGSAVAALCAPALVRAGLPATFYAGAGANLTAAILVLAWRRGHASRAAVEKAADSTDPYPTYGSLLLIARMGHFVSYFGYSTIRILFPKYAITELGWSEVMVATVVAQQLVGLGAGILVANASPWWRGKLWPQIAAQLVMMVCAGSVLWVRSPVALGGAFFGFGVAQSVVYTSALYYGLSGCKERGKSAGIHESRVAAGGVSGCLLGGIGAQSITLVAPFALLAGLAGLCVVATMTIRRLPQPRRNTGCPC